MMFLNECFDLFIESRDTYCSDVTVNNYINTLGYFFDYLKGVYGVGFDSINVEDVSLGDLNQYSIYLKNKIRHSNNPYFKGVGASKISSRTRKDYLKDMCTFFNFLYDSGYIDDNPSLRFKFPKVQPQPIEPLSSDEVSSIDSCFNGSVKLGSRNLAFIHLLLDEGLRSGEVQRLKVHDVNFVEDYIVIRNSKGGKGRLLPLAPGVKRLLMAYFDINGQPDGDSFVFSTNKGLQLSENAIKCVFQRLKSKSGVSRIYPHLLRHTFATSFILGGGSVELLRIYMGHSSIETTQKYLHLANNMRFMKNIYHVDGCFLTKFY